MVGVIVHTVLHSACSAGWGEHSDSVIEYALSSRYSRTACCMCRHMSDFAMAFGSYAHPVQQLDCIGDAVW